MMAKELISRILLLRRCKRIIGSNQGSLVTDRFSGNEYNKVLIGMDNEINIYRDMYKRNMGSRKYKFLVYDGDDNLY